MGANLNSIELQGIDIMKEVPLCVQLSITKMSRVIHETVAPQYIKNVLLGYFELP